MDKAKLLGQKAQLGELELEGFGTFKFRGLTRAEFLDIRARNLSPAELEQKILATALTDPELTEEEVAQWQAVAPAMQTDLVLEAVMRLSGADVDAAKSGLQESSK